MFDGNFLSSIGELDHLLEYFLKFKIKSLEYGLEICRLKCLDPLSVCGRLNNGLTGYPCLNPQNLNVTFCDRRDFANVIKLSIFRWDDYFGLSVWALNVITSSLKRRR